MRSASVNVMLDGSLSLASALSPSPLSTRGAEIGCKVVLSCDASNLLTLMVVLAGLI